MDNNGTLSFTVTGTDSNTVTGPAAFTSLNLSLTIATPRPTVSTVSPTTGTLSGSGFTYVDATGAVKFGSTLARYTIINNTQIRAISP